MWGGAARSEEVQHTPTSYEYDDMQSMAPVSKKQQDGALGRERERERERADLLEGQDESVRIAVRALGAMRNSSTRTSSLPTPALSITSSTASSSSASASTSASTPLLSPSEDGRGGEAGGGGGDPDFVSRVSHFPLVGSAMRAYDYGKNSSRMVKYGAEMVESSVKTISGISGPIIGRLPVDVGQLDEFACRQLDRIDRYRRPSVNGAADDDDESAQGTGTGRGRANGRGAAEARSVSVSMKSRSRSASRDSSALGDASRAPDPDPQLAVAGPDGGEVATRSRWHAMLLEAGGISAALSEESMRRLKYCLQWLQYATAHIDAQILVLRDFTAALSAGAGSAASSSSSPHTQKISAEHMRTLAAARRDVVRTIRQVVDVVSKYAGSALPEPARSRVRGFILLLPQRWAVRAHEGGVVEGIGGAGSSGVGGAHPGGRARTKRAHVRGAGSVDAHSPASSRPASPAPRRRERERDTGVASAAGSGGARREQPDAVATTVAGAAQAAQRILTLSTESLDMMRGVTAVVRESLDRADAWVERLRIVGVQRQQQHELADYPYPDPGAGPGSPSSPHAHELAYPASPPSRPASPWPTVDALDAPSPSPSMYGMGGLQIHEDGDGDRDGAHGDGDRTPTRSGASGDGDGDLKNGRHGGVERADASAPILMDVDA
ncbi:Opi1-domain-containing protein [Athelia psychrophila]|uniref:Opi1-domain-containing protein n=1 Tax=Athelia psychrophila TaxID=1759441 RepID=A0A165ZZ97_9AGAM|nr:Opi1-domain-containing protein [Fibularhizoctonia sp. CBS 109695]